MDIKVLNSNLQPINLIDSYIDFVWIDRYLGNGEVTLTLSATSPAVRDLRVGGFLKIEKSLGCMIIENIEYTRVDKGRYITVSGRSADVLLEQKYFIPPYYPTDYETTGRVSNLMSHFVNTVLVYGAGLSSRDVIPQLDQVYPYDIGPTVEVVTGVKCVWNLVSDLSKEYDMGYRMELQGDRLRFSIYEGRDFTDRFKFSEDLDNIENLTGIESIKDFKNVAYVTSRNFENPVQYYLYGYEGVSGIDRRVLHVTVNNLVNYSTWRMQIAGKEALLKHNKQQLITGTAKGESLRYITDIYIGDRVLVSDGWRNLNVEARIDEYTWIVDSEGVRSFPTFRILDQ